MTESAEPTAEQAIDLKDPVLAALLGWLVPGLGHFYQGRTAKGTLFFVCLMGTFLLGCFLGGGPSLGYGRVVYLTWWRDDDTRLRFLCQAGIGAMAFPAMLQATRAHNGNEPIFDGWMAPPRPDGGSNEPIDRALIKQPSLDELNFTLGSYFELGALFTMVAGLLNILVVYDAWGGPVFPEEPPEEDEMSDQPKPADEASVPSAPAPNPPTVV